MQKISYPHSKSNNREQNGRKNKEDHLWSTEDPKKSRNQSKQDKEKIVFKSGQREKSAKIEKERNSVTQKIYLKIEFLSIRS